MCASSPEEERTYAETDYDTSYERYQILNNDSERNSQGCIDLLWLFTDLASECTSRVLIVIEEGNVLTENSAEDTQSQNSRKIFWRWEVPIKKIVCQFGQFGNLIRDLPDVQLKQYACSAIARAEIQAIANSRPE